MCPSSILCTAERSAAAATPRARAAMAPSWAMPGTGGGPGAPLSSSPRDRNAAARGRCRSADEVREVAGSRPPWRGSGVRGRPSLDEKC